MRDVLDCSSPEPESEDAESFNRQDEDPANATIPMKVLRASRNSFLFNPLTGTPSLKSFYPTASQLLTAFDLFQENVDPVAKIFHRSTLRSIITESLDHMDDLDQDKVKVVVFLALTYSAVTSLGASDCQRTFGASQQLLLQRYRYAMEQALARVRFLDTQNLDVLAATVSM